MIQRDLSDTSVTCETFIHQLYQVCACVFQEVYLSACIFCLFQLCVSACVYLSEGH